MLTRRTTTLLVALVLVTAGLAGCGDGGDDDDATTTTTTEAADGETAGDDGSTTEDPATSDDDGATTEPSDEEGTTTTEGGTTSPDLPADDRPLAELLLDPARVGSGYTADDTLGDGSLDTDLCEEVTLEETWDDQAAQALLSGSGDDGAIFQQAVLRFPDDAVAEAFYAELAAALVTCQPGTETAEVDGAGDEALLATAPDESAGTAVAGLVRVGDLVGWHLSLTGPGVEPPVTEAILTEAAALLAG